MTEHAPDRIWSGIDIPKTIAGVLAALSAAVIGSFLGVAGTLAGAAIASLIGSVGTEIYHRFIDRGRRKLQGTFMTAPAAVGTPPVAAAPATDPKPRPNIRWKRVILVAGSLFVLAMATLTMAELFAGRSIADATQGDTGARTTVSGLFDSNSHELAPGPSVAPTDPTVNHGGTPTTQPTGEATTTPTQEPTQSPTQAPATDDPTGDATQPADGTGQPAPGTDNQNADNGTE